MPQGVGLQIGTVFIPCGIKKKKKSILRLTHAAPTVFSSMSVIARAKPVVRRVLALSRGEVDATIKMLFGLLMVGRANDVADAVADLECLHVGPSIRAMLCSAGFGA